MSFRGFVDKTLLHHRCCSSTESQHEAVLSSIPPWGTKAVGTKAKSPTGNSTGFMWNLCLEVYSTRMSVCKRPAETHVHDCLKRPQDLCPLNQKIQTRCTYTWEKTNKRMGQRLGKHTMIFRLGSESPWFLYGSVWLVGCFLIITQPVGHSQYKQDHCLLQHLSWGQFSYSHTTKSKW